MVHLFQVGGVSTNSSEQIRGVSTNSSEHKKTTFRKMVVMFDSGVYFAHYLYCWKGLFEIYNFLVILFEKFLTYGIHIFVLIYDTLLTASKNTITRPRAEEP
jgi:hypothetical protein